MQCAWAKYVNFKNGSDEGAPVTAHRCHGGAAATWCLHANKPIKHQEDGWVVPRAMKVLSRDY